MGKLTVYHDGKIVGWIFSDAVSGLSFRYSEYADFRLSVSLPISDRIYSSKETEPFFSGLLPDGEQRIRMAAAAHVSASSWFRLLRKYGRDVAGALEILEEDEVPSNPDHYSYSKLEDNSIIEKLSLRDSVPLLSWGGEIRMSLAGAQDKAALFFKNGQLYRPVNGAPSNVILKAGINDYSLNEYVTTKLASLLGLNVPETILADYGGYYVFLTKRFDRRESEGRTIRLHQEDMCQALSVLPENKYEESGGPGLRDIAGLLIRETGVPITALRDFARAAVFNYLFGNCDAHAKNFSLLYPEEHSAPVLSPVYDLMCTTIYPGLSRNLAM
ncbi:MAG: HipA domain-containing protein, partial [Bullifex sp.]